MLYLKYKILQTLAKRLNMSEIKIHDAAIPIWTTTPWTLPANEAVALNPHVDYVVVDTAHEQLIVAKPLLETVMLRYEMADEKQLAAPANLLSAVSAPGAGFKSYRVLTEVRGEVLEGLKLHHPFYDRIVPVVLGEHVTVDTGTGAVHIAPAHGQDDYVIGKKYGLPINNPVADNGCFKDDTPLFAGMHVTKANEKIIAELKSKHTLICRENITHSYPHCWRHKTPLIFRATPQWFISMERKGLRKMALAAIEKGNWSPEWGKARIASMVENNPDWCISRQRIWGTPLPFFIHKQTGELHPKTNELIEKVALRVERVKV